MVEQRYVSQTSLSHRKAFGQFFTPYFVARLMATWIVRDKPKHILDPAFGLGIFYRAVVELLRDHDFLFTGFEIDRRILEYLDLDLDDPRLMIRNEDFLKSEIDYYDAIICNPPYMRFQHFIQRHDVLPVLKKQLKTTLNGYSNIASVFLLKALHELKPNGSLAFIMPYEFFNTGYGVEIKKILLEENLLKQIIIFSNEKEIFPEVTTTVSILLCKKDGLSTPIKITHVQHKSEIEKIKHIWEYFHGILHPQDLSPTQKWTPIISSALSSHLEIPKDFVPLSFYGKVVRGIATGANKFFALSRSQVLEWGISERNLTRCITKSSQIKKFVFTDEDLRDLVHQDKPVLCLDVKDINDQPTREYVKYGETRGFNKRYLTKNRAPWYKLEKREPAPILFGVFNRGRLKVVRNFTSAINFTCYHGFYPNSRGANLLDRLLIYFVSDIGQAILQQNKRIYGSNLFKFEPRDLNEAMCPPMERLQLLTESEVKDFLLVAKQSSEKAVILSNQLMQKILGPTKRPADAAGPRANRDRKRQSNSRPPSSRTTTPRR